MKPLDIILAARDGRAVPVDDLEAFIAAVGREEVPDYQAAAWLMAVRLNGITTAETTALTRAIVGSGEVFDWDTPTPRTSGACYVDKHSTGGVGDKTSFIIAPLLAAMGVQVPMVSGRGLGHTGGTLDKLGSVPGLRVDLGPDEFRRIVHDVGCVIASATKDLAPADRRLYALRDVTGTVDSIPLITGSILGKKLAEGLDALVLDVKHGHGAFMTAFDDAKALAQSMVSTAQLLGLKATAVLAPMDAPLGRASGNACEIAESVQVLRGEDVPGLTALSLHLTARVLVSAGKYSALEPALQACRETLALGQPLAIFQAMIAAQGGDPGIVDDLKRLPEAPRQTVFTAPATGTITILNALTVGRLLVDLGAGRRTVADAVNPAVGLWLHANVGEAVHAGQPLATVHHQDATEADAINHALSAALQIDPDAPAFTVAPVTEEILA